MNTIVIGNCITFVGSVIMTVSGFVKERKKILLTQALMYIVLGIGMLFLGGITGSCINFVNVGRNLYTLKRELTTKAKVICLALQVLLTLVFNRSGIFGWLPVTSSLIITWTLSSKDEVVLKVSFILCQVLWAVYDFSIKNYTTLCFDMATIISTVVGILRVKAERKKNKSAERGSNEKDTCN